MEKQLKNLNLAKFKYIFVVMDLNKNYKNKFTKYREEHLEFFNVIRSKISPIIKQKQNSIIKNNVNVVLNSYDKYSRIRKEKRHAHIYYKSIGKNSFITVLFKNRIIFNTSLGKLKFKRLKIKKKEKKVRSNIFTFSERFVKFFFKKLRKKFKINSVSVNYICKYSHFYPFKRFFNYKLNGIYYKKNRALTNLSYKIGRLNNIIHKENPFAHLGAVVKGRTRYTDRKMFWKKNVKYAYFKEYLSLKKFIRLKTINIINKYPYNGCKKKKIRKI